MIENEDLMKNKAAFSQKLRRNSEKINTGGI